MLREGRNIKLYPHEIEQAIYDYIEKETGIPYDPILAQARILVGNGLNVMSSPYITALVILDRDVK